VANINATNRAINRELRCLMHSLLSGGPGHGTPSIRNDIIESIEHHTGPLIPNLFSTPSPLGAGRRENASPSRAVSPLSCLRRERGLEVRVVN
jgi:hypothetical protein